MKKTALLGFWAVTALFAYAPVTFATTLTPLPVVSTLVNTDTPPAAVKAAVTKLYPTAKNVKFDKEDSDYEASFTYNGKDMSVVLDGKGNVKETETTIAVSSLPATVRDYVAKHHAGKTIKEAAEIVDAKGKKTYEAEVGGKDLIFDDKGTFIK